MRRHDCVEDARKPRANFVTPSEYSIGVFLAEEAVPQSRRGAKLPQRDRRVFLRATVYQKELLLAGVEAPADGKLHKRTPSGSVAIDLSSLGVGAASVHDDSILGDVLGAMELAVGQNGTAWNHVYINMVGTARRTSLASRRRLLRSFTSPSRISDASR